MAQTPPVPGGGPTLWVDVTSCGHIALWVPIQQQQSWETAGALLSSVPWGLAWVASHLQSVGYALRAGLFGGLSQLGQRSRSAVPAGRGQTDRSLAVRLSAPCVPSLPVRLLAALLSPQPLRGRGSLAARKLPCAQGSCLRGQLTKKNSRLARTCLLVFILVVLQPKLKHFFLVLRGRAHRRWHQQCWTWWGTTRGSLMGLGSPCWCCACSGAGHFKSRAPTQANELTGL